MMVRRFLGLADDCWTCEVFTAVAGHVANLQFFFLFFSSSVYTARLDASNATST